MCETNFILNVIHKNDKKNYLSTTCNYHTHLSENMSLLHTWLWTIIVPLQVQIFVTWFTTGGAYLRVQRVQAFHCSGHNP